MNMSAERRASLAAYLAGEGIYPADPPILLPATPYFDLAGEDFGARMLLTQGADGAEYCLRPDFTLPIVIKHMEEGVPHRDAAYGYLGRIFRQRSDGPAEFDQAGLELIAQPDPDAALDRVFAFVLEAMKIYGLRPTIRLGSVALFEAVLAQADMPDVWRSRIRHRFGHPEAMENLLERLANPHGDSKAGLPWKRDELLNVIADQMNAAGLSLTGSRSPEEIVARYFEKQALAQAKVPVETINLLRAYLSIGGSARSAFIAIEGLAADQGLDLAAPLARVKQHFEMLEATEAATDITFEGAFSPRLDYYTGLVFDMRGEDGILASGGEYDRMMQRLGAPGEVPASGASIWLDRMDKEAGQ